MLQQRGVDGGLPFIPVAGTALVAWLDILGYRQLHEAQGSGFMHELHRFAAILMEGMPSTTSIVNVPDLDGPPKGVTSYKPELVGFTDTVIVYAAEPEPWQAEILIARVRDFAEQWAANGVCLRGGLAYGETYIDSPPIRIYGDAVLQAQGLESSLDEVAICLDQSVVEAFPGAIAKLEQKAQLVRWPQRIRSQPSNEIDTVELLTVAWPPDEPHDADWWKKRLFVHAPPDSDKVKARIDRAAQFAEHVAQLAPRKEAHQAWTRLIADTPRDDQ